MKPVNLLLLAQKEWRKAIRWYARKGGERLGTELRREIYAVLTKIGDNPLAFPHHSKPGFRRAILRRFPYSIIFKDRPDDVLVYAIAHHSRKPDYWSRREPE